MSDSAAKIQELELEIKRLQEENEDLKGKLAEAKKRPNGGLFTGQMY